MISKEYIYGFMFGFGVSTFFNALYLLYAVNRTIELNDYYNIVSNCNDHRDDYDDSDNSDNDRDNNDDNRDNNDDECDNIVD